MPSTNLSIPSEQSDVNLVHLENGVANHNAYQNTHHIDHNNAQDNHDNAHSEDHHNEHQITAPVYPDGGLQAWAVVFGAFCLNFATFGVQTSVGIIQLYWHSKQLSTHSMSHVSWIPAVFIFLSLVLSIQFGVLFDRYGARVLLLPSCIAYAVSLFVLAHCTEYWHFMICLGLVGGMSSAAIITISLGVVGHWFSKRNGLANGIVTTGSSVGGVACSLILRAALPDLGWKWSMYILGIVVTVCGAIGILTVRERSRSVTPLSKVMDLKAFLDPRFLALGLSIFGFELLLITALGLIPTYALEAGFDPKVSFYLVTAMNIGSMFGRLIPAYLSDKYGHMNGLTIMAILTLISMCTAWAPFGRTSAIALYVAVVLFGVGTGSFVSISPACVAQLCQPAVYGQWIGALYTLVSVATLISLPIGSALQSSFGSQTSIYFLIGVLCGSTAALIFTRFAYQKWKWVWFARV